MPINNRQMGLLREAIDMAADWRGNQNPDSWEEFDEHIEAMRAALDQVRADRKYIRTLDPVLTAEINRRVPVEQYLLDVFHGKKPLPDKAKCRELARQLGVENDQSNST